MASSAGPSEQSPLLSDHTTLGDNIESQEATPNIPPAIDDEPSTVQLVKLLSGVFLGVLTAAVDSSLIATLTAPISATFGSLSRLSWLASAYFIANAAIQPLSGKLTDIYGRRDGLIVANAVFGIGNLICGFAESEWVLIAGRLVAGIGGGGIMAIATFVLSDLVPLRRRGVWQGWGNISFGLGSGIGGFVGGWINDTLGWRAAFFIQTPITLAAMIIVFFTINIPIIDTGVKSKFKRIDFLGAISLFSTLILGLLALSSGGNLVPWTHPLVLVSAPLSLLSFVVFIITELKFAAEPIIPIPLLWDRSVAGACLTNSFMSMARFALLFYLPVFLQVQGYSPTQTGLRLLPGSIATALSSMGSGLIVKWTGRYFKLGIVGQALNILGMGMIATFVLSTPAWPPYVAFVLASIGFGAMLTMTILAILSSTEQKHQAVITSALFAFRSTGTVLGISIASLIFQNVLRAELWKRIGEIDHASDVIKRIIDDLGNVGKLEPSLKGEALEAYMVALRVVFISLLGMSMLAAASSLVIRDIKLPNRMSRKD